MNTPQSAETVKGEWVDILKHYLDLFWRKKWLILSVWPVVTALVFFLIIQSNLLEGKKSATVLIGMDKPIRFQEGESSEDMGPKKIELIRSRPFLTEVVDQLALRLQVKDGARDDRFDSLWIGPQAVPGPYRLRIPASKGRRPVITRVDDKFGNRKQVIPLGESPDPAMLLIPDMVLKLKPSLLFEPTDISFTVISARQAVDALLTNLTIERPSSRKENYFTITLKGRDYPLTARTANAIADLFVRQNLGFGKRRLHEKLELLTTQLSLSRNRLAVSDNALRSFLTENPSFALDRQTEQTVGDLVQQEAKTMDAQSTLTDASRLKNQFNQAGSEERTDIANEILMMLSTKGVLRASVLQSELTRLLTEKESLGRDYSKDHPLIRQNQQRTESVLVQTSQTLNGFIQDKQQNTFQNKSVTSALSSKLRNLPQKSFRLAELRRTQQTDSEAYALLMSRYNQAKVEDAVDISDVFVMDYAVEPLAMSSLMQWLFALMLGGLTGALFAFGPVMIFDLYRKTALTEVELTKLTDLPFLESIPLITPSAKTGPVLPRPHKTSPILITEKISPEYANEVFRSLRTKILLNFNGTGNRSLLITSLDSGAGKSTLAANLAIAFARNGIKPLLVDGDLRLGHLNRLFGLNAIPGLSDYLTGDIQDPLDLTQPTHVPGLFLISSGTRVLDSAEWLTLEKMKHFLGVVSKSFDIVILDSPPLGAAADAVVIQELFARIIIVVKAGASNISDLNNKIDEYPPLKAKIAGLVLNRARRDPRFKYFKDSPYINLPALEKGRPHART